MIQLTGAGKRYGPKVLFENVDWLVTPQERAGIVGANGTGKSSLLKVLAGIESLDYGGITSTKGIQMLREAMPWPYSRPVWYGN